MNPDFALVLNFKIPKQATVNYDELVKKARDIGVRAITRQANFEVAAQKYTIALVTPNKGQNLTKANVIQTMVNNRKLGKPTIINVNLTNTGQIDPNELEMLELVNDWMHLYGHAFNEGKLAKLSVDHDGFVLENRHQNYQKYLFLQMPLPKEVTLIGLEKEPNRVEWIENRVDLPFKYQNQQLNITLSNPQHEFAWVVLRIQAHRPEDDLGETKF